MSDGYALIVTFSIHISQEVKCTYVLYPIRTLDYQQD